MLTPCSPVDLLILPVSLTLFPGTYFRGSSIPFMTREAVSSTGVIFLVCVLLTPVLLFRFTMYCRILLMDLWWTLVCTARHRRPSYSRSTSAIRAPRRVNSFSLSWWLCELSLRKHR